MEIWKIRQKSTGLFSVGGAIHRSTRPESAWSDKGKSWNKLHHLKSHLNLSSNFYRLYQDDIEIVKMVLTVSEADTLSMREILDEATTRHHRRHEQQEQTRRERRLEELAREKVRIEQELKSLRGKS